MLDNVTINPITNGIGILIALGLIFWPKLQRKPKVWDPDTQPATQFERWYGE